MCVRVECVRACAECVCFYKSLMVGLCLYWILHSRVVLGKEVGHIGCWTLCTDVCGCADCV